MSRLFDDASSQYLEIDSAVLTAAPITVACWANTDSLTPNQVLFNLVNKDSPSKAFRTYIRNSTGRIRAVTLGPEGIDYAQTSAGLSVDTWHHCCGIYAASDDRRAFLDGGSKGTDVTSITPTGVNRTSLGREGDPSPTWYLSGKLAEAAIWNVALTDAEVLILSKGYSPLFVHPQNLVAYWPLVRDPDNDIVGGFNMTAFNTPTVADHPRIIYPQEIAVPAIAAAAPPAGGGQVIGPIITKEMGRAQRIALASGCMIGNCSRRDFNKKAILAATIGM